MIEQPGVSSLCGRCESEHVGDHCSKRRIWCCNGCTGRAQRTGKQRIISPAGCVYWVSLLLTKGFKSVIPGWPYSPAGQEQVQSDGSARQIRREIVYTGLWQYLSLCWSSRPLIHIRLTCIQISFVCFHPIWTAVFVIFNNGSHKILTQMTFCNKTLSRFLFVQILLQDLPLQHKGKLQWVLFTVIFTFISKWCQQMALVTTEKVHLKVI